MKINISKPQTTTVYPDIENNAELPEADQFAVILEKPSALKLAAATRKIFLVDGEVQEQFDWSGSARAYVKELVNPPTLSIDGKERRLRLEDVFNYDDLLPIRDAINAGIEHIRNQEGDTSPKN